MVEPTEPDCLRAATNRAKKLATNESCPMWGYKLTRVAVEISQFACTNLLIFVVLRLLRHFSVMAYVLKLNQDTSIANIVSFLPDMRSIRKLCWFFRQTGQTSLVTIDYYLAYFYYFHQPLQIAKTVSLVSGSVGELGCKD